MLIYHVLFCVKYFAIVIFRLQLPGNLHFHQIGSSVYVDADPHYLVEKELWPNIFAFMIPNATAILLAYHLNIKITRLTDSLVVKRRTFIMYISW